MNKFNFVLGNPPYQMESQVQSETNGQNPMTNIFQYFQMEADKVATNSTVMIYPGSRWIHQSGKGLQAFGKEQINSPELSSVDYYPDASDIFDAAIDGGVTIVVKSKHHSSGHFRYTYNYEGQSQTVLVEPPGDELLPLDPSDLSIVHKVSEFVANNSLTYLCDRILPRTLFGIESEFAERNPDKVRPYVNDDEVDYSHEIKLFTNDRAGKKGRAKWFVTDIQNLEGKEHYIREWQVAVSSANAGGQKRDNQLAVFDSRSAFGRARVALGSFKTEQEAENFYKYCSAKMIRYLFLLTNEALSSLGKRVVDMGSYDRNEYIDFSKDIDSQLFKLFNLTNEEIMHGVSTIKDIDGRRGKGVSE